MINKEIVIENMSWKGVNGGNKSPLESSFNPILALCKVGSSSTDIFFGMGYLKEINMRHAVKQKNYAHFPYFFANIFKL